MSAYLNCRYWNSDSFFPNCFLDWRYFLAAYKQNVAPPKLQLAILILPPSRAFIAILKPIPSSPILFLAGILTLSKETRTVGWIVHPILSSCFPKETPAASPGTMKVETYFCEVFAITMYTELKLPPDINILDPLITYSSPSFWAKVFIAWASDPLSGSVRQ